MFKNTVALPPDLFPPAHKAGEGALLRVWLLGRATTSETRRITRSSLMAAILEHLGVQEQHAGRLLERGDGLWWRLDTKHDFVYFIGAKPIMLRLGGVPSDAPAIQLAITDLATLKGFYARCYAAYMQRYVRGDTAKPVSRAALIETFGVTKATLRSWEKAAHVRVIRNYAFAPPEDFRETPDRPFHYHCNCGEVFATTLDFFTHHSTCTEDFVIAWDRPNSYMPPAQTSTGSASPIGRKRLAEYAKRKASPDETTLPLDQSRSVLASSAHVRYGWLNPGTPTRYTRARVSDPLPVALINTGISLKQLWRAL